jgi:hypothetical protein
MTMTLEKPPTEEKKAPRPMNLPKVRHEANVLAAVALAHLYFKGQHKQRYPRHPSLYHECILHEKTYQRVTKDGYADITIKIDTTPEDVYNAFEYQLEDSEWVANSIRAYLQRAPVDVTIKPDQPMEYRNPGFTLDSLDAPIMVQAPDLLDPIYHQQLAAWMEVADAIGVQIRIRSIDSEEADKKVRDQPGPNKAAPGVKRSSPMAPKKGRKGQGRRGSRLKTDDKKLNESITQLRKLEKRQKK